MSNEKLQKFIDDLKKTESGQASRQAESTSNPTAVAAAEENNLQNSGGNIMGRFSDRVSQYPGRIKLTKVSEDSTGVIYDCVSAEGVVTNEGTPLNAETLNALADNIPSGMSLYLHRVRLQGDAINGIKPIGIVVLYSDDSTPIESAANLASAFGLINGDAYIPAAGCVFGDNNSLIVTCAHASYYSVYLYGMYFGYVSGNGEIQRISSSVTSVSDVVTQII